MIRFHAFSFFLSRNKREKSARKDACSILCLLFAFQDCFCSSSQIILAVISIEIIASEKVRQARAFLLMKCPISLFSSLSLECGAIMSAHLSFAQKLYPFCSESTRKEAVFSLSTVMIIITDDISVDERTLGFLREVRIVETRISFGIHWSLVFQFSFMSLFTSPSQGIFFNRSPRCPPRSSPPASRS